MQWKARLRVIGDMICGKTHETFRPGCWGNDWGWPFNCIHRFHFLYTCATVRNPLAGYVRHGTPEIPPVDGPRISWESFTTQEGAKNIGSNVFVKARESRYIKVTVWKYKVSFELSMNEESSHQTWIFFCLASRPERTGTCGQTCPNDIKSRKKCLKHVKFLGDHEWDFTRAVGQQHQAINNPYASNEGEGCGLQLWAELRCYPQIPVGLDMFLQITLADRKRQPGWARNFKLIASADQTRIDHRRPCMTPIYVYVILWRLVI